MEENKRHSEDLAQIHGEHSSSSAIAASEYLSLDEAFRRSGGHGRFNILPYLVRDLFWERMVLLHIPGNGAHAQTLLQLSVWKF